MGFIAGNIIQLNGCFGKPCWIPGKYQPQLPQFSLVSRFRKMKSEMCVDVFLFLVFLSGAQSALLATFGMLQVLESLARLQVVHCSRAICQYAQYIPVEYGANANCDFFVSIYWLLDQRGRSWVCAKIWLQNCQCIILFRVVKWNVNPQLFWHNPMDPQRVEQSQSNPGNPVPPIIKHTQVWSQICGFIP